MGTISLILPQIGLSDSTEDVKIPNAFTTIQTLVNGNIDPSNLNPTGGVMHLAVRSVTTNTAAAAGDLIVVSGGTGSTITLPAPTVNALVAVFTVGAAVTTISSAAGIYTVGTAGATVTSIPAGGYGTYVVLQCDGTHWYVISGQQDSGWAALSLSGVGSVTAAGGYFVPAARLVGDRVYLRGGMTNGGSISGGVAWATIPASLRPASQVSGSTFFSGAQCGWVITTAGALSVTPTLGAGVVVTLDGSSYTVI